MIATLSLSIAAIALAATAYLRGVRDGKAIGLATRIDTALPRELVPTRQLRRGAARQVAKRIALAAAKTSVPLIVFALMATSCANLTGTRPAERHCTRSDTLHFALDSLPSTVRVCLGGRP